MDSFLTLSNPFKQIQSFNQIIPAAYFKSATLNSYIILKPITVYPPPITE